MRIVVTGATSFVGSAAVKELLSRGHEVWAVLRKNSVKREILLKNGKMPGGLILLEEDLGGIGNLVSVVEKPVDVFLHMGWRGAGSDCRKDSAIQKASVSDALLAVRTAGRLSCRRFLFTGSQAEYGIRHALTDESSPCRPTSPYGEAKLLVRYEAEKLCRELEMDYGHIRIFSTYGPGDHPWSLVSTCLSAFQAGESVQLTDCTQLWNFLYITDAAQALADMTEYGGRLSDHGCVYNLGGPMGETGPLQRFVEKMYDLCGRKGSFQYGVRAQNAEGASNLMPDIKKLEAVLGWTPKTGFEQGILKMLRKL